MRARTEVTALFLLTSLACLSDPGEDGEETMVGVLDAGTGSEPTDSGVAVGEGDGGTLASERDRLRQAFFEELAPMIGGANGTSGACGACHAIAGGIGPAFMLPNPDMLTTMLAYPGIIGGSPEASRLYAKGAHLGPAFTEPQATAVASWIDRWNGATGGGAVDGGVTEEKPRVEPFVPTMGANTIDLSVLGATLQGATLTFDASLIGSVSPSLRIANINLKAPAGAALHAVHPLWVVWPGEGMEPVPDPSDSFASFDQTIDAAGTRLMEPGLVLLPNFTANAKLSVVFVKLETVGGNNGGGPVPGTGCKNVAGFTASVRPTLNAACRNCHGGGDASAALAYSLRGLENNSAEAQAAACASTLGVVNLETPAMSRMYQHPDPNSGIPHPFKFNANDLNTFRQAADAWIISEK